MEKINSIMNSMRSKAPCPCGKGKILSDCCGRFLEGSDVARTPEQLMRSRYSAYALGGFGDYLLQTWFPATAKGLTAAELSQRSMDWQGLEIIGKGQDGDSGWVEFKASFINKNAHTTKMTEQSPVVEVMHELSEFIRNNGRWYYVGGRVS
jgi:SEC-C motif domain protein